MTGDGKSRGHPAPLLPKLDNRQMQPFYQGDLDSLCGLYAAVNALRLVLAPVRQVKRPEALNWFRTGLEFLGETGNLQDIIGHGIGPPEWLELMEILAVEAGTTAGCRVDVLQPLRYSARATRARMYGAIEDAIVRGQPVLITLSGSTTIIPSFKGSAPSAFGFSTAAVCNVSDEATAAPSMAATSGGTA